MNSVLDKFRDSNNSIIRLSLFVFTLIIILCLFPRQAKFKYEFTKGKPWLHETIIAPFDFLVQKTKTEFEFEKLDISNGEKYA